VGWKVGKNSRQAQQPRRGGHAYFAIAMSNKYKESSANLNSQAFSPQSTNRQGHWHIIGKNKAANSTLSYF